MSLFVSLAVGSLTLAAVYAAANVGFVLLYRATGVPNFAQGALIALGAYLATTTTAAFSYWPGIVVMLLAMALIGAVAYAVLMRWLFGVPELDKVILTFMLASVLLYGIQLFWGAHERGAPSSTNRSIAISGARVSVQVLLTVGTVALALLAVLLLLTRTMAGRRFEALSHDETLAAYRGIRVHHLAALGWAIASALAGLAGVLFSQVASVSISMSDVVLLAFPAVVIGSLHSLGGAVVASLGLAIVTTTASYRWGSDWGAVIAWLLLLVVLTVRPEGLFSRPSMSRL